MRLVGFRIGDLAVQVILVDREQNLGQHLLGLAVHVTNILAAAGNDHQVGHRLQLLGLTIGLQQCIDVLARIRARQRQYDRAIRIQQEAAQLPVDRTVTFTAVGRVKFVQRGTRRDDAHRVGLVMVIETVLLLNLLVGAGDHQLGRGQDILLGLDAT